jgi:hypothetical protein
MRNDERRRSSRRPSRPHRCSTRIHAVPQRANTTARAVAGHRARLARAPDDPDEGISHGGGKLPGSALK